MKNLLVVICVCLVVHVCNYNAQAHPHRSIEETEEDVSSESESTVNPVVMGHVPGPERESSHTREMTSHEGKSHEDDDSSEEDRDDNSDEDGSVKFPKTESLCPARPEEITNIEMECAREYQLWKELRAKKDLTTTPEPFQLVESNHSAHHHPHHPHHMMNSSEETMHEDMQMSAQDMTTEEMTTQEMTTEDMTTTTMTDDDTTTEMMTTQSTTPTTTTTTTTSAPVRRSNNNSSGRKHRRSVKTRKRSCYPATCILKKLNLLDSMGQPSIKQIQKFAVNMTVDDSMNLEEKAVECVKEINEAMIDASTDIGKKVGCVAQKVITCLNKGLTCPIMKVPH